MDFAWLATSGALIGIIIFALKVSLGCGLASLSRKETLCIATSYLILSLVMGLVLGLVERQLHRAHAPGGKGLADARGLLGRHVAPDGDDPGLAKDIGDRWSIGHVALP